ncbi:pre-mRNA-splicing regulator WTAP [Artemisia annua]|uniref:Pre-mRNA-splicing regulator WTAP n=1 Tax=Artemisia annua TaxID=35608 RepID=A0A2U1QI52_ARTAN|nr:pre-mRNA-splicing regulator WTAP [Artemisia annua]
MGICTGCKSRKLVEEKDKKIKELEANDQAVNFTSHGKMGKMLMAKCRTLQEEKEEIGNQSREGKIHELPMKLALQKSQNLEFKNHFEGLSKNMEGLTNDIEKSHEMGAIAAVECARRWFYELQYHTETVEQIDPLSVIVNVDYSCCFPYRRVVVEGVHVVFELGIQVSIETSLELELGIMSLKCS